jgi:hypothetical protein
MSEPKEVHFFNEKLLFGSKFRKPNFSKGLKWYKKIFQSLSESALKGEITPRYFNDPIAAERIKKHNSAIKIFVCLRNPVDRILSQYNFAYNFVGNETRPIEKAIAEERNTLRCLLILKTSTCICNIFRLNNFSSSGSKTFISDPKNFSMKFILF